MKTRKAQCSCGKVTVTAQGEPIRISVCHCYACQLRTGSIFGVHARFHPNDVDVVGDTKQYTRTGDDGGKVHFFFCPDCGATVLYKLEQDPDTLVIPVGAFADSDFPKPTVSVYQDQQHSWFNFEHEVEHFD